MIAPSLKWTFKAPAMRPLAAAAYKYIRLWMIKAEEGTHNVEIVSSNAQRERDIIHASVYQILFDKEPRVLIVDISILVLVMWVSKHMVRFCGWGVMGNDQRGSW